MDQEDIRIVIEYIATKCRLLGKELLQNVGADARNIILMPISSPCVLVKQNILEFGGDGEPRLRWRITISEQSVAVILDTVLGELVEIELHLPVKIDLIWLSGNEYHAGILDALERRHFL